MKAICPKPLIFGGFLFILFPGCTQSTSPAKPVEWKVNKPDSVWKKQLTPQQYYVLRLKGTERAFTGEYWDIKIEGKYCCVACSNPLFHSSKKFDSGTGWPSFYDVIEKDAISTTMDYDLGYARTEVICSVCGGHLGHVFDDESPPTRLRYCINSAALKLTPLGELK